MKASEKVLLKEQALESFYFFCKVILGYRDMVDHFHLPVTDFLQQTEDPGGMSRRLILLPRSSFKSTVGTISYPLWRLCRDPNLRIMIISDTEKNASRFLTEIKNHFQHNKMFQAVFSEMIPPSFVSATWNATEMVVHNRTAIWREPSIDVIGVGGGAESRHYDLIIGDDMITEKAIHSDLEMERAIEWTAGLESLLVKPDDEILWIGSRKKRADLYDAIMDKFGDRDGGSVSAGPYTVRTGGMLIYSRAAIENGEPVFPERIPIEFLTRLSETDPERYNSQYANNPIQSGRNFFSSDHIKFFEWKDERQKQIIYTDEHGARQLVSPYAMERMCLFDPSKAEHKRSSKNAQLVVAKGGPSDRFILEANVDHYPPDIAIDYLFEVYRRWKPSTFLIEHRGFQGSIKYWLAERSERDNLPPLSVLEWPFQGSEKAMWSKEERIKGLIPLFRAGYMWLAPELRHSELHEQLLYYPNARWDDGIDCLAMSLDVWEWFDTPGQESENKQREEELLFGAGHLGHGLVMAPEKREWNEEEFLAQFDATGYGMRLPGGG